MNPVRNAAKIFLSKAEDSENSSPVPDIPNVNIQGTLSGRPGSNAPNAGEGELVRRRAAKGKVKGRMFYGCTRYPDCDFISGKSPEPKIRNKQLQIPQKLKMQRQTCKKITITGGKPLRFRGSLAACTTRFLSGCMRCGPKKRPLHMRLLFLANWCAATHSVGKNRQLLPEYLNQN